MDNLLSFPTKLDKLAEKIKHDITVRGASQEAWAAATLDLCLDLAEARAEFAANSDFGRWLDDNQIDLNDHDRAAAIAMGQDPKRTAEILATTERRSLKHIFATEFRLVHVDKTPEPATKTKPHSAERLRAFAAYDALKAAGEPITYDTIKKAAGCGYTAVRAVFTIRQNEEQTGDETDMEDPCGTKGGPKLAEARAIVRPMVEANEPLSRKKLKAEYGISAETFVKAIYAEQARKEALAEAKAQAPAPPPAPIDTSILSASQQVKFEALEKRLRRDVMAGFEAAVAKKSRQWCEDIGLTAHRKEMDELKAMLSNPRTAVMRKHEYNTILMCLHPDRLKAVTEAQLAEAFRIFTYYKLKMIDDDEERIEARRKLHSNMPATLAEMLARKKTQS